MFRWIGFVIMVIGWLLNPVSLAQDFRTFQPRESFITFDYPATWLVREEGKVVAIYSDAGVLPLSLNDPLVSGQFKILLVYLTPDQRAQANIAGTDLDSILQSAINNADVTIPNEAFRRYEFNRRLTLRSNFTNEGNEGAIWMMEMPNDAVVMMQVMTAPDEQMRIEGGIIELLRSLRLTTVRGYLDNIVNIDRPLQFNPQLSRLVFTYPEGWTIREPNDTTVVLTRDQTQISLQIYDYDDLSLQGIPIADPVAVLASLQARSERPDVFEPIQQVTINNQPMPYSDIQGDGYIGTSLGRDLKVGFLWVTVLSADLSESYEINTLSWALLLTTSYRPDVVTVTERVIMPQHQFGFFYPSGWQIRQVTPSSYMLGTSPEMIDQTPDNLQFTDDAQLLVQYVTADEYAVASANTSEASEVLGKFIQSTSDLTTYDTPRNLRLGVFEFAQVDFDHPNYSGTALLAPMADGGALWMQLRTAPAQLGNWEPVLLAIARSARIFNLDDTDSSPLEDAVFDALNVEPTLVPTPTRRPGAPPELEDVVGDVVATPVPTVIRTLDFDLPPVTSTYSTNISQLTVNYPAGWLVQERFPATDFAPTYENTLHISNNANLLLSDEFSIEEGDAEIIIQYTRYEDLRQLGLQADTLYDLIQLIVSQFETDIYDEPLRFRINGEVMILVTAVTETRQSISLHREVPSGEGYIRLEMVIHPDELEIWLPTAIAVIQSAQVP